MNMLKHYIGATIITAVATLSSCNSTSIGSAMQAAGVPGEVMLVMDGPDFSEPAAHDIVNNLQEAQPSLPQLESRLEVTSTIARAGFDGMIRRARNIVLVNVDPERFSKTSLSPQYDVWAEGQLVVQINAPSLDSVSSFIKRGDDLLAQMIIRHELYRLALAIGDKPSPNVKQKADSLFGLTLDAPRDITKHKVAKDFLWMSNGAMRQRHDILLYSYPYHRSSDLELDRIVAVRDSVLKANIQGEFEGSYPSTVSLGLYYRRVRLPNTPIRTEVRGLWQMEGGAMMGGPFVLHAYHDQESGRVIVAEGFVYHPNEEKLTLLRTMEAMLYSLRPATTAEYNPRSILSASYTPMK